MAEEKAKDAAKMFGDENVSFTPDELARVMTGRAVGQMLGQRYIQRKAIGDITNAFGLDPRFVMQTEQMVDAERDRKMQFERQQGRDLLAGAQAVKSLDEDMVEVVMPGTDKTTKIPRNQLVGYINAVGNSGNRRSSYGIDEWMRDTMLAEQGDENAAKRLKMAAQWRQSADPSSVIATGVRELTTPTSFSERMEDLRGKPEALQLFQSDPRYEGNQERALWDLALQKHMSELAATYGIPTEDVVYKDGVLYRRATKDGKQGYLEIMNVPRRP